MAGPKRILLVDDDEGFNFLNRMILNDVIDNCSVSEALNGSAALEMLSNQKECPEVILLDINMPGMDGFEFLQEFEKHPECYGYTKIFILTSSLREEDKISALDHKSVVGYFDKPLSDSNIAEIIAKTALQ